MKIKSKILTTLIATLCMLLFFSVPAFADSNHEEKSITDLLLLPAITSIEATNGKIVVNFSSSVTGLTSNDFNITTLLNNEECILPSLTFNSEDNSFTFNSLNNKSIKKHTLTVIVSASETSTKITGVAGAAMTLKPHGVVQIKLDWNWLIKDLDANLELPNGEKVYNGNKNEWDGNGNLIAQLDKNSKHSLLGELFGLNDPETTTIYKVSDGKYKYYVDSAAANNLKWLGASILYYGSGAEVNVYINNNLVNTFDVLDSSISIEENRKGYDWNVFEIVNGKIVPINTIAPSEVRYVGLSN